MLKTKNKLFAAAAMLMVSAIMLTTASFAWFTISTNPEITALTTTVVTNENLEIALANSDTTEPIASAVNDTGKAYTWGNLIDLSGADVKDTYDALTKTLRPATLQGTFQAPVYGTDGRPGALTALIVNTMDKGFGTMTDGDGKVYGYYIDFWVRSNMAGAVTLSPAAKRSTAGEQGKGTVFTSDNQALLDNIAIATQPGATGTITAAAKGTAVEGASQAFTGKVVDLAANKAQVVRVYVYLEGANVTNAAASLEKAIVTGGLNLQFAMTDVDQSMEGQK